MKIEDRAKHDKVVRRVFDDVLASNELLQNQANAEATVDLILVEAQKVIDQLHGHIEQLEALLSDYDPTSEDD